MSGPPIFRQHFTLRTEQNYSSCMGQSGRKLMLALVAFGAGGFVGLVAAAADDRSSVGQFRRSATHADVVAAPQLNVLPLLPAPASAPDFVATEPREQINSAVSPVLAQPTRLARPAMPARKPMQHMKSATWTRRSDIIDPWSNRR